MLETLVSAGNSVNILQMLLLSSLSLKSGVRLASILVIDFFPSSSSLMLLYCGFPLPFPLPCPSLSRSLPVSLFINRSPSILSTCPAYFNQLITSFLLKLSFTPTSSLNYLFFSLLQFFSHNYFRKLAFHIFTVQVENTGAMWV